MERAKLPAMRTFEKLTIKSFKSIRKAEIELGSLNIFVGGNGVGKSNLIQVFGLLKAIGSNDLQDYVATRGGADSLLHFGRKRSSNMVITLHFRESEYKMYLFKFQPTPSDELFLRVHSASNVLSSDPAVTEEVNVRTNKPLQEKIESFQIFHFHDTSDSAKMKLTADLDDNRFLRPHAENLAAFLYWMQEKEPLHFQRIQETLQQIAPFFERFELAPLRLNESKIKLEWKEKGSDAYFNASAFSDGTLRFICLATLLLQPDLPGLILLDEPELGLHPAAITLLAEMLTSAATKTQIIVATQSVTLINQFGPDVIWTVDREEGQSVFRRLDEENLREWLEGYSVGELWEKNVIGARP